MTWYLDIILAFATSFILTYVVIPRILLIAFRKRLFDIPNERKKHQGIVPRLGGVSFLPSIVFSVCLVLSIHYTLEGSISVSGNEIPQLLSALCCSLLLYFVGLADDLIGVRYRAKFAVQIFSGILLCVSGLWINNLHGLFGIEEISPWFGIPFTIFTVVFITNAINLIDGIDGLASGLSIIAVSTLGVLFAMQQQWLFAIVAFAYSGVLIPFFYYNVFGETKRIFMGDTGSLTIGLMISFLSIRYSLVDPTSSIVPLKGAIVVAFSLMLVPLLDVIFVVLTRLRNGTHPFKPDRNHIHHRLLAIGFSQKKAMVTILSIALLYAAANIFLITRCNLTLLLAMNLVSWTTANLWISKLVANKKHAEKSENATVAPVAIQMHDMDEPDEIITGTA